MIRIKCVNSLAEEQQCWKWHPMAGVTPESVFQGALKAVYLCLQVPKTSGVSNVLNPSSSASPSISSSVHPCNYNFRHLLLFFLPFLVPHHHDYCLLPAKIPATLLFCSFKITVTRQRRISVDIIFFLMECTGVYHDSICRRIRRKGITL